MSDQILSYLAVLGYRSPKRLKDGRWAAILPLMFHDAIVCGTDDEARIGYSDRWCFARELSDAALAAWDGEGEPEGWHRHPATGRRRKGGLPEEESIAW